MLSALNDLISRIHMYEYCLSYEGQNQTIFVGHEQIHLVNYLPEQLNPFPVNPTLQVQMKLPGNFEHLAFGLQPPLLVSHSLITVRKTHQKCVNGVKSLNPVSF